MTPEDRAASRVIEAAREESGMSKAELARRAGISERSVKYYLAGERAMTLGAFRALHAVLGLDREEAARRIAGELLAADDATE
jgi:transcriptional regulator with XRE-family HTH domain